LADRWTNQPLRLFHGTDTESAKLIQSDGVDLKHSRPVLDFGPGFYTTTSQRQATTWARSTALRRGGSPSILVFDVERPEIAALPSLWFVRGTPDDEDFWGLVGFCRAGGLNHGAEVGPYDLVAGPVTLPGNRLLVPGSDQVSFHTARSLDVLNRARTVIIAV
jgi:hypothetical protein